jgi:NAD+ synthase (glutamine-hydrolysing)
VTRLRIALCQLDTAVGDITGNTAHILDAVNEAEAAGADLIAFPELTITGYPPEDLLLKPAFIEDNRRALDEVAARSSTCAVLVGFVDLVRPQPSDVGAPGAARDARRAAVGGHPRRLRNAVAVCCSGAVAGVYHKRLLPNYGVFDEQRWFAPGSEALELYRIAGVPVGLSVCEDLWFPDGPVADQGRGGAALVVNVNGSPYSVGRRDERRALLEERAAEAGCALAYVNQVGGQDELVFDGASMVVDAHGELVGEAAAYVEELLVLDLELPAAPVVERAGPPPAVVPITAAPRASGPPLKIAPVVPLGPEAEVYEALVLGTRDYLAKNGFTDALVGLSGGIDSSLVAAVAADAVGPGHVHGIAMPSRYSSEGSVTDAVALAERLGIELSVVPIEPAHHAFSSMLAPMTDGDPVGLTDENLQSRLRGIILMAVSNARSWIVLTTGNKSELATGYSTLYGDSAGGFAVIKDVPKTLVYRLCRYRNDRAGTDVIPESVLTKAPSAELRPDQRDDQSLPPYEVLDPVLAGLVEEDRSVAELVEAGWDPDIVARVARLVDLAEYKRRQSPPGVRITARAFGKDRRMPITNRYRDRAPSAPAPSLVEDTPTPTPAPSPAGGSPVREGAPVRGESVSR